MVGLMGMHGLSLATGMEITEFIPQGLQVSHHLTRVKEHGMYVYYTCLALK